MAAQRNQGPPVAAYRCTGLTWLSFPDPAGCVLEGDFWWHCSAGGGRSVCSLCLHWPPAGRGPLVPVSSKWRQICWFSLPVLATHRKGSSCGGTQQTDVDLSSSLCLHWLPTERGLPVEVPGRQRWICLVLSAHAGCPQKAIIMLQFICSSSSSQRNIIKLSINICSKFRCI